MADAFPSNELTAPRVVPADPRPLGVSCPGGAMLKDWNRMEMAGRHDGSWKTKLEGHTRHTVSEAGEGTRQAKVKRTQSCHQLCPHSRDGSWNSADSRCPGSADPTGP